MIIRNFVGFPPEVLVTTAELAEKVYAVDAGGGRAGAVRRQFLEPVVGQHSLLSLDGDPWWRHRRLLSPPLHGKAISAYRGEIAQIAAAQIDSWPVGTPFALRDRMQDITLEVILRLVFGVRDPARLAGLRATIPGLADAGASVALSMMPPKLRAWAERSPVLRRLSFLPTTRFLRVRAAVDDLLFEEIAQRRATADPAATDVLSRLLAARDEDGQPMSDQELRDELITLLEAGHETTATGLAWAFERLLRNTGVLSRLQHELAAGRDDYLAAVVKEALRSRPVADLLPAGDGAFDAAVVSLVLCSVPDQGSALSELRRVIRPGGQLRFLEHVRATGPRLMRAQRLLDATLWPVLGGGCHTSRDTVTAIQGAGFSIESIERFSFPEARIPLGLATHPRGRRPPRHRQDGLSTCTSHLRTGMVIARHW